MEEAKAFQFTHPVWGATHYKLGQALRFKFQFTHPVRGAMGAKTRHHTRDKGFNSRTPCGVRQSVVRSSSMA